MILAGEVLLNWRILHEVISDEGLLIGYWLFGILSLDQVLFDGSLETEPHVFLHVYHLLSITDLLKRSYIQI